jgi:hypothetical protein
MLDAFPGDSLRLGLFRFTIAPVQPLEVPAVNKGNMLRGAFGHAFRRLCCIPRCKDAQVCLLGPTCPYKAVFEPSPPPGADRLSKNQDIPRPFVFRASQTHKTRFLGGERFEFDLVLIGRALDFLPYFVLSFRELAAEGLGLNRARCSLERVEQIMPPSTDSEPPSLRSPIQNPESWGGPRGAGPRETIRNLESRIPDPESPGGPGSAVPQEASDSSGRSGSAESREAIRSLESPMICNHYLSSITTLTCVPR